MEYTGKIRVFKAEDRQVLAGILSANKYQVWQGAEKVGKNKTPVNFLYYQDIKEATQNEG